ncbi:THUMP domain-containing protein [Flavobacteriaceae bacterium]|nr:THUMP domain-containing protein [Flavobacteriaceae bacterium]
MNQNYEMTATTLYGLEEVLANELKNLGAQDVKQGNRSVTFVGDMGFMYKANMALRTAIRILKPIQKFKARDEEDLYKKVKQIRWDKYLDKDGSFLINAAIHQTQVSNNSHFVTLKTKDAIADYFREKFGQRPDVDAKYPDLVIHVHISREFCTISLDSSGASLHKRGYRTSTNIAPINEVLAAGMLLLAGYTGDQNLIDPMCGSGTILIEGAMIANNIPANINRKHFGFENWKDYDEDLFFKIQDVLLNKITSSPFRIMGFDKAPSAVRKAQENVKNANLSEFVGIHHVNFFLSQKEVFGRTMVMFNPPYGERLQVDEIENFYRNIGDTLKKSYPETTVWFITSDFDALKHVGLRTSRRIALKNGPLDCKLVRYDMYEGSRKAKKNNP